MIKNKCPLMAERRLANDRIQQSILPSLYMTAKAIEKIQNELKNIGPTMAKKLVNVGIDSPEKLRKLGAKKAFLKLYEKGQFCSKYHAAYLYALEGAIRDCDWRAIPESLKKEYKKYTAELRSR